MPNIKILVCAHKKDYVRQDDVYMPVQVGKAISDIDLGFQGDDTGDNISKKNAMYAELTAMYWAWKNLKKVDFIGLCHYRRYFLDIKRPFSSNIFIFSKEDYENIEEKNVDFETILKEVDVVCQKPSFDFLPFYLSYGYGHCSEDLAIAYKILSKKYPEYLKDFEDVLLYSKGISVANMFVMKWKTFEDYSNWLFDILFECEKHMKALPYSYQTRSVAFLAERLFNVYCSHNSLRKMELPIAFIENKTIKPQNRLYGFIKRILKSIYQIRLGPIRLIYVNRKNVIREFDDILKRSNINI